LAESLSGKQFYDNLVVLLYPALEDGILYGIGVYMDDLACPSSGA
jgi:hypothetical protein